MEQSNLERNARRARVGVMNHEYPISQEQYDYSTGWVEGLHHLAEGRVDLGKQVDRGYAEGADNIAAAAKGESS